MQLWWILISWNSCPCIELLSGGLAYMFYEYLLCKAVKKGIKMLSMHHCQLLVRHWNKVIRMWHKKDISIPVPRFSLLLCLLSGIRQFHWILVLLEKKVHNRCDLRRKKNVSSFVFPGMQSIMVGELMVAGAGDGWSHCAHCGETEGDESWCSVCFPLFSQYETPAHGAVLPTLMKSSRFIN